MTAQMHKRHTNDQVKMILERYLKKELSSEQAMDLLELKRSQFFELVKRFKENKENFSIEYKRNGKTRGINKEVEESILKELCIEKGLIDDTAMPVRFYNYSYVQDQMIKKYQQSVSIPTIINRAKKTVSTFQDLTRRCTTMKY